MNKYIIGGLVVAVIAAGAYLTAGQSTSPSPAQSAPGASGPLLEVAIPAAFTDQQAIGQRAFEANCASCHGPNAAGRDGIAPPLIHKIYEPSHHGDEAFQRAVALGVQSHHWPFGNMPAITGLTRADVEMIASYIRALQVENGIN